MKPRIRAYTKAYFVYIGVKTIVELEPFGRCMVLKSEMDAIANKNKAL
jgi:hypothetical protein